jgi:hypothetical protein
VTCEACFGETAEDVWDALAELETRRRLVDESHFGVSLDACRACGQLFAHVFAERIDWQGGNDPQAWILAPVSAEEADALAAAESVEGAVNRLAPRRRVEVYHPSDGDKIIRFVDGPIWIMPHD